MTTVHNVRPCGPAFAVRRLGGWVPCSTSASQSQPKKVIVTRSSSSANECKVGNDRYCRNLNRHYKQACGSDQFSSLTDCKSLRGCADIEAMIVRAARCKAADDACEHIA